MKVFFMRNKRIISLCAAPLIALAAFIGFDATSGQVKRSEPLTVNKAMAALLEQNDNETISTGLNPSSKVKIDPKTVVDIPNHEISSQTASPKIASSTQPAATNLPSESIAQPATKTSQQVNNSTKISLNKASIDELMELSGIGESKAKAIMAYREARAFQTLEELMNVKGIGPKIFEKIKAAIEL